MKRAVLWRSKRAATARLAISKHGLSFSCEELHTCLFFTSFHYSFVNLHFSPTVAFLQKGYQLIQIWSLLMKYACGQSGNFYRNWLGTRREVPFVDVGYWIPNSYVLCGICCDLILLPMNIFLYSCIVGTSSWSTCLRLMQWMPWRMQMDTSWISSTPSEWTFSQTLISECSYHVAIQLWGF